MDVDVSLYEQPVDDLSLFDLTPEQFPWREPCLDEINIRRIVMSNKLFFDILLELGGVEDPSSFYPPVDIASLRRLLDTIDDASYDSMKRNCLVYYLLKWHGDGREAGYAEKKCISPHYVAIADAYWHLDTGVNLERAIALFSDARIVNNYITKIVDTLSLSDDATSLILMYVRCCRPALTEFEDMRRYCLALAEKDFADAWEYQRQFTEDFAERKQLLHKLFEWTCTPKLRFKAFQHLLVTPISLYEESVLKQYATVSPSELPETSAHLLRDLFCVRLIQNFKYVEAVKFDREFPDQNPYTRGSWSFERKRLLNEVISAMPTIERAALETELKKLEPLSKSISGIPTLANDASRIGASASGNAEMLWEDIPTLPTNRLIHSENRPNGKGIASQYASPRRILPTPSSRAQAPSSANGMLSKQSLFTPGASTSSNRQHIPLIPSTPTPVSGNLQSLASSSQLSAGALLINKSSISAQSQFASSSVINNTSSNTPPTHAFTNGTPKSNAFTTRNAFFDPPVSHGSIFGSHAFDFHSRPPEGRISPPKAPATTDEVPQPSTSREDDEAIERSDALDVQHSGVESDREDLGYSIFNDTERKNPSIQSEPSPSKARALSEQRLPPGAFIADGEEDVPVEQPHYNLRRLSRTPDESSRKQKSRKRAASPENLSLSIPGSLTEEIEQEENEDVAPLPNRSKRPARKSRRMSRTSSTDVSDAESSRPVRRSTRISNASSPTATKPSSSRSRKNARSSNATATGRGSRKR